MAVEILSETPISAYQLKEELAKIKQRDKEILQGLETIGLLLYRVLPASIGTNPQNSQRKKAKVKLPSMIDFCLNSI